MGNHPSSNGFDDNESSLVYTRYYKKRQRRMELENVCILETLQLVKYIEKESDDERDRRRKKRKYASSISSSSASKKSFRMWVRDTNGELQPASPQDTPWYSTYVSHPPLNRTSFHTKFRHRFRCSYATYKKHLLEVSDHDSFLVWSSGKLSPLGGRPPCPIELLLLGTLRYLGRSFTMDDLEEHTGISSESHRIFLHAYLEFGSTFLFNKYVTLPTNDETIMDYSSEYALAGFNGCIGSTDATHIGMLKCFYNLVQYHDSFKLPMPSRTYNLTATHRHRILYTTKGHPGRWNDKTLVLFDQLSKDLRDGKQYSNLKFHLYARNTDGTFRKDLYCGAWTIVDNGYLDWPTTVPPKKFFSNYPEMRFSRWLESMRKDVECTFGILKKRFTILKFGIPLVGIKVCDMVWLTCCALHNMILEDDGLDDRWDLQKKKHGESDDSGDSDDSASDSNSNNNNANKEDISINISSCSSCVQPVHLLSLEDFRERLIVHFDILWKHNKLVWPTRSEKNDYMPPIDDRQDRSRWREMNNNS